MKFYPLPLLLLEATLLFGVASPPSPVSAAVVHPALDSPKVTVPPVIEGAITDAAWNGDLRPIRESLFFKTSDLRRF